mgnify:CR=1 FL=1
MAHYFEKVESAPVARSTEPEEPYVDITPLRSLIIKMAWPAQKGLSTTAYGVSMAAQQVTAATLEPARTCNKLLAAAKAEIAAGRCQQIYRRTDLGRLCIVTFCNVSYVQEDDGHSQAAFYSLVTDESVLTQTTAANPIEHSTNKTKRVVKSTFAAEGSSMSIAIDRHLYARMLFTAANPIEHSTNKTKRVVKSTFAAEGSSMSIGIDRHLYARMLIQASMNGKRSRHLDGDRRRHLRGSGYLVADANSLYVHLHTMGSMPAERSAMLDLLGTKELVEQGIIELRWCPTQFQFVDHPTKAMKSEINAEFLLHGRARLTQAAEQASVKVHKSTWRQEQRQRRKARMKRTVAAGDNQVLHHLSPK